jgi:cytochrome c-type biogenesis protein CcmF
VTAEVGIRSTWRDDLYVVLIGLSEDGRATFRLLINPMVGWLWAGAVLMIIGGLIAAAPARRRPDVERQTRADTAPVAEAGAR